MSQILLDFFGFIFIANDGSGSDGKTMERRFNLGLATFFFFFFFFFFDILLWKQFPGMLLLELYEWIHHRHFYLRFYKNCPTKISWVPVSKTKKIIKMSVLTFYFTLLACFLFVY